MNLGIIDSYSSDFASFGDFGPQQVGNSLTITGANFAEIAALNSNTIAIYSGALGELRTYQFDGTNWTLVGNAFSLTLPGGGSIDICKLTANSIVRNGSSIDALQVYEWDGSDWSFDFSSNLSSTGFNYQMVAMTETRIAQVFELNPDRLQAYDIVTELEAFSWSAVGNFFNLDVDTPPVVTLPTVARLSNARVAVYDQSRRYLRTMEFDGADWSQIGNSLAIADAGNSDPDIAGLTTNRIAFVDESNDQLRLYVFDGSDWSQEGASYSLGSLADPSITALSPTRVVVYNRTGTTLTTYDLYT